MKKALVFAVSLLACAALFAAEAEVTALEGKAQISTNGTSWSPVSVGSKIPEGATIQTGFKSSLKVKFKGSVYTLEPMTRIKFDELSDKGNIDNAVVSMKVGGLTSNVKKLEDRRAGFTVKGPAATASVRGTIVSAEVGYKQDIVTARENTTEVKPTNSTSSAVRAISEGQAASVDAGGSQQSAQSRAAQAALGIGAAAASAARAEAVSSSADGGAAVQAFVVASASSSSGSGSASGGGDIPSPTPTPEPTPEPTPTPTPEPTPVTTTGDVIVNVGAEPTGGVNVTVDVID